MTFHRRLGMRVHVQREAFEDANRPQPQKAAVGLPGLGFEPRGLAAKRGRKPGVAPPEP